MPYKRPDYNRPDAHPYTTRDEKSPAQAYRDRRPVQPHVIQPEAFCNDSSDVALLAGLAVYLVEQASLGRFFKFGTSRNGDCYLLQIFERGCTGRYIEFRVPRDIDVFLSLENSDPVGK